MPLPFIGPSYQLALRKASIQRAVNLFMVGMEAPTRAPYIMQSVPGLTLRAAFGAEVRGAIETNDRAFVVAGGTFYELFADFTFAALGALSSVSGPVGMEYGLSQVVVVDGSAGYVFSLTDGTFTRITSPAFYGSASVGFIAQVFTFVRPGSQQFEVSAINDAATLNALDFASAEQSPDNLVTHLVDHEDAWLFGTRTVELWAVTGAADFPLSRRSGATMEVGCMAAHSARKADNSIIWLGRDRNGAGVVYRAQGYTPIRISTQAVEQALAASTDLSAARAYTYQQGGLTFYCLNAPGLAATWCYEVSTGQWHERCELGADGAFTAGRAVCALFAFGRHLVGDAAGKLYELDPLANTNAGDPLVRERVSPHAAAAGRVRQFFPAFYADVTTGEAPQAGDYRVELSWSGDSGASWSNPVLRSIGRVGERFARLLWTRLGSDRDRVWRLRFSGDAPFALIEAGADVEKG